MKLQHSLKFFITKHVKKDVSSTHLFFIPSSLLSLFLFLPFFSFPLLPFFSLPIRGGVYSLFILIASWKSAGNAIHAENPNAMYITLASP